MPIKKPIFYEFPNIYEKASKFSVQFFLYSLKSKF